MNKLITLCIIIALLPTIASATKYIRDDTTGGDATSIGTWDLSTKTCTLANAVSEKIQIMDDGITLDGAGYTVTAKSDNGIYLFGISGVTIKNVIVTGSQRGIALVNSYYNTVTNNTIELNISAGIQLDSSDDNVIADNIVTSTTATGIALIIGSDNNTLIGNTISNNEKGIYFQSSSNENTIYNNNFIDNVTQASGDETSTGNIFYLDLSIGGNYWSDYDGLDIDCDGIGDTEIPYIFSGGEDALPWVDQDGWLYVYPDPESRLEKLIETVASLNLENGINNSLDAKLQNALDALEAKNAGQRQDAINKMQAFINAVEAQSGDKIPESNADYLIAVANCIISLL